MKIFFSLQNIWHLMEKKVIKWTNDEQIIVVIMKINKNVCWLLFIDYYSIHWCWLIILSGFQNKW